MYRFFYEGGYDHDGDNASKPYLEQEIVYIAIFQRGTVWLEVNLGSSDQELNARNINAELDCANKELLDHVCYDIANADPNRVCNFKCIGPGMRCIEQVMEYVSNTSPRRNEDEA